MEIPAVPKPDISLVDVKKMGPENRHTLAHQLYLKTLNRQTCAMLEERNLGNVVKHYGKSPKKNFDRITDLREATDQETYALVFKSATYIGMATVSEGIKLKEQDRLVPAVIARRTGLSHEVDVPRFNVSGWLDAPTINALGYVAALTPVYEALLAKTPDSWTLEANSSSRFVHEAIMDAGYRPTSEGRYDEMEHPGVPPISTLYLPQ